MDFIAPMMVLIVGALVIGSIFRSFFINRRMRENARAYVELQGRLIDKFGDAAEVTRYLESGAGQRLLAGTESGRGGAHARVLDSLQTGIIAFLGGVGLQAASGVSNPDVHEVMNVLGRVSMLVGVGFIVAAVSSQLLLKSWGLLGSTKDGSESGAE